jgi:hypothetical protein
MGEFLLSARPFLYQPCRISEEEDEKMSGFQGFQYNAKFRKSRMGVSRNRNLTYGVHGYALQTSFIGHTRHTGLRAVQTVAPKSIRAWLKS